MKDEEIRKLKFRLTCMEDDVEDLNEQLAREEERADLMLQDLDDATARVDELDGEAQGLHNELRIKARELETAKAEIAALSDLSNDTTKVLKEKLALAREVANLKPELEHLRAQATSHQTLLSEKLALERQLSTVQVELDNAKRTVDRASSKTGKNDEKLEDYKTQVEELKKELKDAKSATKKASSLEQELATSQKEIETLKSKASKPDQDASLVTKAEMEAIRKELATEKKERARAEKALEKEQAGHEAQRQTLEDKVASFRTKLKSTKEKLKQTETELDSARTAPPPAQKSNKRAAEPAQALDPDAMLGTPGDHAPTKRGRKAVVSSAVGDKSTFSITPFLNRTMSLAPESPGSSGKGRKRKASEALVEEMDEEEAEAGASPSTAATEGKKVVKKPKALAPASSAKQNSKPPAKRSKTLSIPSLEKVAEESEIVESPKKVDLPIPIPTAQVNTTAEPATYKETTKTTSIPLGSTLVPKLKPTTNTKQPRKSLLSFAAFNEDSEVPAESKKLKSKKKKLLKGGSGSSGFGKTLFDEEEEGDKVASKPVPGRGLFAKRALGGGGAKKGAGAGFGSVEESGFVFSPLKKDRRAMALAQSMLGN